MAFDYLRTFGVLLVLLHHTVLAYSNFALLNPFDPMATFSPVVDGAKAAIVGVGGVAICWSLIAGLRCNPTVRTIV